MLKMSTISRNARWVQGRREEEGGRGGARGTCPLFPPPTSTPEISMLKNQGVLVNTLLQWLLAYVFSLLRLAGLQLVVIE